MPSPSPSPMLLSLLTFILIGPTPSTTRDEMYSGFMGSLNNLCNLIRQYELSKNTNEAMFVIKAYRTLRDKGPYPADQVIKELDGSFAFVLNDRKASTLFAVLGSDGGVKSQWGIAADGSMEISDGMEVIKANCCKSFNMEGLSCRVTNCSGITEAPKLNQVKVTIGFVNDVKIVII